MAARRGLLTALAFASGFSLVFLPSLVAAQSTQEEQAGPRGVPGFVAPALREGVAAEYPKEAREADLEGTVILEFPVDDKGAVGEIVVKTPAGHGFDEAAVAAVRRFVFAPALADGTPV